MLKMFSQVEMDLLVCGLPSINADEWQAHTVYRVYDSGSQTVNWFWELVEFLSDADRCRLFHFATSYCR